MSATRRPLAAAAGGLLVALGVLGPQIGSDPQWTGPRYADARIDEPSGLAASRRQPGVFWTHNDSGGDPMLYAVTADGRTLGRFVVEGAEAVDWEAIAIDDAGRLYIGDIGNNANVRRDLVVYRVLEPEVDPAQPATVDGTVRVERAFPFAYPEQTDFPPTARIFDAEALFVDGKGAAATLYLLTKRRGDMGTTLYRFPALDGSPQALVARGEFDVGGNPERYGGRVTGADLRADGRYLAVLTYHALFVFARPTRGDDWLSSPVNRIDFDQDLTVQTEAVAWHGEAIVFSNEQGAIFRIDDPLEPRTTPFPDRQP